MIMSCDCLCTYNHVTYSWFFGKIKRGDAEKLLLQESQTQSNPKSGTFLIRESENTPGGLSLSVRDDDTTVKHYRIRRLSDAG